MEQEQDLKLMRMHLDRIINQRYKQKAFQKKTKFKFINVDYKRLKEIVKAVEQSKKYPSYMRTYKINNSQDYWLRVLIKKGSKK